MTTYQETRTLDLVKRRGRAGGIKPVTLRRGESGMKLLAYITLEDEAFPVTGYTARFCAMNANGEVVARSASIVTASAGSVSYTVTSDLTAWAGNVAVAYFELAKSGETATSDTIPIIVLDNADMDADTAAQYQSAIDALMTQLEGAIGDAQKATSAASGAASSATSAASNANSKATAANAAASAANTAASNADAKAAAANAAAGEANTAATAANTAASNADAKAKLANTAADSATTAASSATGAAGRANSAADEAEAFLRGFVVEYDNLSDECKAYIAQSASAGVELATDEDMEHAFSEIVAPAIADGNEAGRITQEDYEKAIEMIFG